MTQLVETLNALGRWLFEHLSRLSIELLILAGVVAAAIYLLRIKRPATRHAFWCLVLIKPAVALFIASPVSLYWYLRPEPAPIVRPALTARPPLVRPATRPPMPPVMPRFPRPRLVAPRSAPPSPTPSAWEMLDGYGIAAGVWSLAVLGLSVRLIVGFAYVGFLRQTARRQKVGLLAEAVREIARELKIRRSVAVAISEVAHGPVLAGIVRPIILLPRDLAESLTAEQARLIIGHELAHVRRWDNLVLLIQRLIEVFFFFHPVIWLAGRLIRREAEIAADDTIISAGGRPADYADALARAAEVRAGLTRRLLVNTFAAGESNHARRIRRILNGRVAKTSLAMGLVAAVVLVAIGLFGLPTASERKGEPDVTKKMHIKTSKELAAAVKRDGSKVWIEGVPDGAFGISWDMLVRAMQTLLAYRGEKAELDELLAYSGDAFNLCHGSNWQGVSYLCAPTDIVGNMAEAYGYEYEPVHNGFPFETLAALERPARLEITERTLDHIRAEIEAGRPPLVGGAEDHCGSWTLATGYDREGPLLRHVGDHEPYRWTPIRGVAAGSTDEDFGHWNGRFRGTIRDGFVGGWQDNPAYLIKQKKARTPTRRENVLAALARGVQLHRAPTHHIGSWGGVDYHFGRRAYEEWARELHQLDYPADLKKPLPDEAYDWYEMVNMHIQADQIVRGRSAAATFCEKAVEVLPNAKDHLLAAAKAYREESAIAKKAFAVFLAGTKEQREAWLSGEAQREAGVTAIAQMLEKDELAVRHIQAALAAAPAAAPTGRTAADLAAAVKREGGKVWIEGVPNLPVGRGDEWDGMLKGLHLLMTHRGEDATLEELMALSGDAFHICFGAEWQMRSVHSMPTDPLTNAARALGYEGRWTSRPRHHGEFVAMTPEARAAEARQYLQEVHSQIDAGMPVLFGGVYGECSDWRAAVGYDSTKDLICYVGGDEPYDWTEVYDEKVRSDDFGYWDVQFRGTVYGGLVGGWLGNAAFLPGAKTRDVSEAEQAVTALRRAVDLHHAQPRREHVTFYFGARAYEQWAKELHELVYPADFKQLRQANPESYDFSTMLYLADQIVRGRSAAAAFCEKAVEVLPNAKEHLLAAAKAYREESAIAKKAFAVFLAGTKEQQEAWLSDEAQREAGVTAIGQMLEKDEQAVRQVQAALAAAQAEAATVAAPGPAWRELTFKYGFRHDPMKFVEKDESLQGALVRKNVFRFSKLKPGDHKLVQDRIEALLAKLPSEGAGPLVELLELGCDPHHPKLKPALSAACRGDLEKHGELRGGALTAALLAGWQEGDEPMKSLRAYAEAPVPPPGQWDPWSHCTALRILSAGRKLVDVRPAIARWMQVIDDGLDELACWNKMDVWDILAAISRVEDPRARGIVERYIPMLLRSQGPDGGWGGKSPQVFRALVKHGLLAELRDKPPLPPDWRVVRTIPAPKGTLQTLTWDGKRFWVLDTKAKQAIAISPEDGAELKRLDLEIGTPRGLGWYDGLLVVTAGGFLEENDPARVFLIDADRDRVVKVLPFTNDIWYPAGAVQVGRLLWTSQYCWVTTMDVATGQCKGRAHRGAWPLDLAFDGRALWGTDALMPGLYRYDLQANLLDFAEMPFFESLSVFSGDKANWPVTGIVHNDQGLWVLSNSTRQIAVIEKTESGKEFAAALAAGGAEAPPPASAGGTLQLLRAEPVFDIPKLEGMTVRGDPDDWGERGFRVGLMHHLNTAGPLAEFAPAFRLGWSDEGLLVLCQVRDDALLEAEDENALWRAAGDCLGLYVIPKRGERAVLRLVVSPGLDPKHPAVRALCNLDLEKGVPLEDRPFQRVSLSQATRAGRTLVRAKARRIKDGYVLEVLVPWKAAGIEPKAGGEFGLQVFVADTDQPDRGWKAAIWYPQAGTFGNTHASYRVRLAAQPSPPVMTQVNLAYDGGKATRIAVTAPGEKAGKTVTVVESGRTLAEAKMQADESGYAVASIPLPLPRLSRPLAQPVLMLDGETIGTLSPVQLRLENYAVQGHVQDTFSLAVQAAARLLGRDVDFETICCLSSNAFAPMLDVGENCTAWWMCQASMADRCIETIAGRVGLKARKLELPEATGKWDDKEAMAAYRRKIAPILRQVMDGGEVIVTTGGWEAWQEHGLVPWCWAGIITEARDDGTILGAFVNGRTDNIIHHPYVLYALSPAEPTLSPHKADLIMLKQAVARIRGAEPFQSGKVARYGLAAMAPWIAQMRKVPYCPVCEKTSHEGVAGCAYSSASPVYGGAKVAASYLRRRVGTFQVAARPHLDAAARHYDRIVELLQPAMTGQGGDNYGRIIHDQAKQNQHAEVLESVKAELAAAADAMEKVLAAELGQEFTE